jgi:tryptophanyl-tRNA synthetase
LIDDAATIRKKVMKAVTDNGPTEPNSVKPDVIQNLFTILEVVSAPEVYDHFNEQYNRCTIRYGDLKKQLAEDIIAFCTPIRERIIEYASDTARIDKVAALGADKARESATRTLCEVRRRIGFRS